MNSFLFVFLSLLFTSCRFQCSNSFAFRPSVFNCHTEKTRRRNQDLLVNRSTEQNYVDDDCQRSVTCQELPKHLQIKVDSIANDLWDHMPTIPSFLLGDDDADNKSNSRSNISNDGSSTMLVTMNEGECKLDPQISFSERSNYFKKRAIMGYPDAQHSYALLAWSGFGGVSQDAQLSAQFHAAAASQNHLDGLAVLGGCLRTGTGVKRDVKFGLQLIEYCASVGNPTGVNKKGALLESNDDERGAFKLYETCYESGRVNALLLFNLGWCLVHGVGVEKKDPSRGIALWIDATDMAPDEGSEEAAWNLYEEYKRDDPKKAKQWIVLAVELGHDDALIEISQIL